MYEIPKQIKERKFHKTFDGWGVGTYFFRLKLVKFLTMGFWDSLIQAKNLRPFLVL